MFTLDCIFSQTGELTVLPVSFSGIRMMKGTFLIVLMQKMVLHFEQKLWRPLLFPFTKKKISEQCTLASRRVLLKVVQRGSQILVTGCMDLDMDHMRISGIEPSSVILSQTCSIKS